jgi:regulator of protease activity HflC (stomatin/prohibitin superfamily)
MDEQTLAGIITLVIALIILYPLLTAIRVVPEYERLVILMLGRYRGTRGPGLVMVLPFVEQTLKVDLRQKTLNILPVALVTADKAGISQAMTIVFRIVEPVAAVLRVENAEKALATVATTVMRAVIAEEAAYDVKFKSESIRLKIQAKLDEAAEKWGVKIVSVELRADDMDKNKRDKI